MRTSEGQLESVRCFVREARLFRFGLLSKPIHRSMLGLGWEDEDQREALMNEGISYVFNILFIPNG